MLPNPQETADLVILTEEILNGKHHFLLSVRKNIQISFLFFAQYAPTIIYCVLSKHLTARKTSI